MGFEEIEDRVFHQRNSRNSILNCPSSSVMATDSISDNVAGMSICSDPFYASDWDPIVSGNQTGNFLGNSSMSEFANNPHYPVVLENQTMGTSYHLVHFPSDSGLVDIVPKISSFGSGSFSEMVSSFDHMDESGCHPNFPQNQRISTNTANSRENREKSEDGLLRSSPNGKRKRKNVEIEQQKDQTRDTFECPKEDEKKNVCPNSRGKEAVKQAKDNSNGAEEPSKENYIHVRAKRGQATNSHSLAERVRRERISERMRLLQELVPGCNKITGKAVMLDEIINYVQSLQQQVEFLSMKLATVNPELNLDIERILSKDILHPRGSNGIGIGPGLSSFNGFPGTTPQFRVSPQNLWNNDLQSILQMGFDSNPSASSFPGISKMEL